MASGALRGDTVYSSEVGDLPRLRADVAGLRGFRLRGPDTAPR